jgi:two-component system sensor histidine kinase/response regulator
MAYRIMTPAERSPAHASPSVAGGDPAALVAPHEPHLEAEVRRAALRQLLGGGAFAESLHVVLILVVAALVWNSLPRGLTIGWVGGVIVAAGLRTLWRLQIGKRTQSADEALRGVRLTVAGVGLAWGIGAAAAIPGLALHEGALILVVLTGIIAGATSTLVADRRSFRYLLLTVLAPLPVGILLQGHTRFHVIEVVLIVAFAWAMDRVHGRAHRTFGDRVRAAALLELSTQELARQHAYLDALIASTPVAIAVLDNERGIRSVNPAFETLFGYSAAEVQGARIDTLIVPDSLRAQSSDLEARARRGEIIRAEVERVRKDGRPIQVRMSAAVVAATEGGLVALYEDISDRKKAEEAMRAARDLAERVARARSTFLANMSHEIRTPMNAVLGFVELVLDTELSAEQRRALELVRSSSEALLTILNDILDYSKIEAEHLELEAIPFDLPKVVHATATLLAVRAREKHLELTVDVPPDVPRLVRGDPTRVRQVLMNLIGNAIKFTEQGEVDVSAGVVRRRDDGTSVQFRVRDTGIGIAEEQLATIFQEFTQADASTTRRYGGTGLGLAISRRLVALMGGELTVTSEAGRGSEFSFTLPFQLETPAGPAVPGRPASLGGRRLLVVDDNETNRRILRDMLGAEGVAVHEASRADAGLEALRRAARAGAPYDLAVLDAQMPDQDGFELATAIRADVDLAHTRLLILTSAGQRGDGERCRQLGIQAYLTKPIARAELIEAVGTVLADEVSASGAGDLITRHSIRESRHTLRILLAEDNVVNQQVATAMLVKRGHEVDVVSNGREAVDAVGARSYDVVLMDIQMPEMDGFTATERIRALPQGRTLPIIALTAHALSGERERCLAHGMSGYVAKPFRAHDLFAAVEGRSGPPGDSGVASPAVDVAGFRRTMEEAGAEHAVDGILATFVESAPQRMETLVAAVHGAEPAPIERAAHAFRSAAATIGARGLAVLLEEMEAAARNGHVAAAREKLEHVQSEAQAALDYLRTVTKGGKDG